MMEQLVFSTNAPVALGEEKTHQRGARFSYEAFLFLA